LAWRLLLWRRIVWLVLRRRRLGLEQKWICHSGHGGDGRARLVVLLLLGRRRSVLLRGRRSRHKRLGVVKRVVGSFGVNRSRAHGGLVEAQEGEVLGKGRGRGCGRRSGRKLFAWERKRVSERTFKRCFLKAL
jgi:hypothetical protein